MLRDLSEFLDEGLTYPLPASAFTVEAGAEPRFPDGKTYTVPSPDATTGVWLTAMADLAAKATIGGQVSDADRNRLKLDDDDERTLYQRVLGPVYDEMVADGVKWTALQTIGRDAYLCFAMSQDAADRALAHMLAGQGEALARANRATRRAAKRTPKPKAGSKSPRASGGATGSGRARTSKTSASSTSADGPTAAKTG